MDDFKKKMMSGIGPGGLNCLCCNDYFGKSKGELTRATRKKLKESDKHLFNDGIYEFYYERPGTEYPLDKPN